jgi:DNA-binding protein WhiA
MFSDSFTEDAIVIREMDPDILDNYVALAETYVKHTLPQSKNGRVFNCIISDKDARILNAKMLGIKETTLHSLAELKSDCCKKAFLRGMFIGSGVISDPQKRYSLEFTYKSKHLAELCAAYISELGYEPGTSERKEKHVVYVKNSESIKDFLTMTGGVEFLFDYTNAEIYKEFQNNVNRIVNCESANIDKAVRAMTEQRTAIKKLKAISYEGLTPELIEIAEKRLASDTVTLDAFGKEFNPPIAKATLYRKLKKICEMASNTTIEVKGEE